MKRDQERLGRLLHPTRALLILGDNMGDAEAGSRKRGRDQESAGESFCALPPVAPERFQVASQDPSQGRDVLQHTVKTYLVADGSSRGCGGSRLVYGHVEYR